MKTEPIKREWSDCDHQGCIDRAMIRKNNMNLCYRHYEEDNLIKCLKWNHANGLETDQQRQDYVFNTPFKFKSIT
jgi:hypothetical protein|tara:strand:- start:775 stop:999 length:225 start_codon:yes stop_codon:yes gene_type:complete